MLETDRPIALREAIMACRNGGTVSVIGVYGGFIDKFPMGSRHEPVADDQDRAGHVQRYMRPLLERIEKGEIDPSFVITHRLPLDEAPRGYEMFLNKQDECVKVVLEAVRCREGPDVAMQQPFEQALGTAEESSSPSPGGNPAAPARGRSGSCRRATPSISCP